MLSKGPHISIEALSLVPRVLRISEKDFDQWPDTVRAATIAIAKELFLAMYNPYIPAEMVKKSVSEHFEIFRKSLAHHYATSIAEGISMYWSAHESTLAFQHEIIGRIKHILPPESIDASKYARIANATDATDLRLELPLLVVMPKNAEQIRNIVLLANEIQFAIIPRGGGSGLTGGAIPAHKRSIILSTAMLNTIGPVDSKNATMTVEAGVLTQNAINAADKAGLLFSVDPASKTASSIGGNIAENAGGPLCFEYGTTIDNLISYRMVTPTGEIIEITRKDHPRHKIHPEETVIFEVHDSFGSLKNIVTIPGPSLRKPGLGKDVTNKALCGLPGLQKEGVDGIITDATFILHEKLKHFKVIVLEFFGRSMENSMRVIGDIVSLRDAIRLHGDKVKISALEEFNAKYVQAIGYCKKSFAHEGDPISVLILQLDSNYIVALDEAVAGVVGISGKYNGVDVFVAQTTAEAELYWEDRHRLSAIAKRTSGFKINEDVVIPLKSIPEFSRFLEAINLEYMGRAYRTALKETGNLSGLIEEDLRIVDELAYVAKIIQGEFSPSDLSDQELQLHAVLTFGDLAKDYPMFASTIAAIEKRMLTTCICVASHMHAGDGNCHVNIPVNSNDPVMLAAAEKVAHKVMAKAQELGGEVTGEHGIGITKIAFLSDEKMADIVRFKQLVDPLNILNPAKLTQRELPVVPFTFSFNHLIHDIRQSGLANKERLISLLTNVQVCTRCGKCKQVCPMHDPNRSLHYNPRNKNLVLGALVEAIYYTQVNTGKPLTLLLDELRKVVEHCTGCGKCEAACPVKIASSEVALNLRSFLEDEGAGGHPLKAKVLKIIAKNPAKYIPRAAKMASMGQGLQNKLVTAIPDTWKKRIRSPLFSGQGPRPHYRNLYETLHIKQGSLFVPAGEVKGTVVYFPGCGGGVFFRHIGLASITMALCAGYAVLLPKRHLCCGYPLLASGAHDTFAENQDRNITHLRKLVKMAAAKGFHVSTFLTACGSCRDGMERHFIPEVFEKITSAPVRLDDAANFLFSALTPCKRKEDDQNTCTERSAKTLYCQTEPIVGQKILYHSPCHTEIPGVKKTMAANLYAAALSAHTGSVVQISPGCCGESGLGALTSPEIFNRLRERKSLQLQEELASLPAQTPIVVSCPSCLMGIRRILLQQGDKRTVIHSLEYMADQFLGNAWKKRCAKLLGGTIARDGIRLVHMKDLPTIQVSDVNEDDC